ncbi:exopolygalacturonase-like [Magnolia sinica]|uniref:exopolygalacturonase-like n=1 Tax=Magnolia sinica TaxID=86752 RepID=UPI00265AD012|nr:exopolygalacturonase-like [Magnolia sinica]
MGRIATNASKICMLVFLFLTTFAVEANGPLKIIRERRHGAVVRRSSNRVRISHGKRNGAHSARWKRPSKEFDVAAYGAVADGATDSAQAMMNAWKAACAWPGKRVAKIVIPQGTFLMGPAALIGPCRAPVEVQIQGVVKATVDVDQYKDGVWIHFQHIHGLKVSGGGTFDGQGASAWPQNQCSYNAYCKLLPTSVKLSYVTGANIRRISSINPKFYHFVVFQSTNIKLQALKIISPKESPNTDGIHIGDSNGVKISKTIIGTGDDCISIGEGSYNVTVLGVTCGPGHGISVGSLGKYQNEDDVIGVRVKNCTLTGTTNGLRIKTWPDSPPSSASKFLFENIVMNNVYNPIIIDQEYCPTESCSPKPPSRVRVSQVIFKNIKGTSASQVAVKLLCSKGVPCQNVHLTDIFLKYTGPGAALSTCSNVIGTSSGIQIPSSCV